MFYLDGEHRRIEVVALIDFTIMLDRMVVVGRIAPIGRLDTEVRVIMGKSYRLISDPSRFFVEYGPISQIGMRDSG